MDVFDYSAIGQRIKTLRKSKGLNQQDLANLLGNSLRTVQKYETGEIEVSIAIVNELAKLLDTTPTFILGYETDREPLRSLADIMALFFKLDMVEGLDFQIDVRRPPHHDGWSCSLTFNGKNMDAEHNADMCLFLENWERERENVRSYYHDKESYEKWQDKTLAYYAASALTVKEFEELDHEERMKRRIAYLNGLYPGKKED